MIQVNQKLVRLLGMMGEQQKEINLVKSAMKTMREEFDSLRATVSTAVLHALRILAIVSQKDHERLPLMLSVSN